MRCATTDRAAVLAMVERHEGAESAAIAAHWLERQPQRVRALRGKGAEPLGVLAQLALHEASATDLERDPGARADVGARPGATAPATARARRCCMGRFVVDRDAYQAPSPRFNVVTMTHARGSGWAARA